MPVRWCCPHCTCPRHRGRWGGEEAGADWSMTSKAFSPRLARVLAAVRAQLHRFNEGPPPSTWHTPITLASWDAFQVGLARALGHVEVGTTVVIDDEDRIYVQFAQHATGLHVEAVSNRFLREEQRRAADQRWLMSAAVWRR